jgi:hypothetical protein
MRRVTGVLLLALWATTLAAQDSASTGPARVTYVVGGSYYINKGRQDGLVEGSEVFILHGDSAVAQLRVQYLSSHQSSASWSKESGHPGRRSSEIHACRGCGACHSRHGAGAPHRAAAGSGSAPRQDRSAISWSGWRGKCRIWTAGGGSTVGGSEPVEFRAGHRSGFSGASDHEHPERRLHPGRRPSTCLQANLFWQRTTSPWRATIGRQFSQRPRLSASSTAR